MTDHKTMNTIIHAAFRRDLARFHRALDEFPAGSRIRANQLAAAWDNLVHQLQQHHQDEEAIFFPVLRSLGADEVLVGDLDGEHSQMRAALDVANAAMLAFRVEPSKGGATAARDALAELKGIVDGHLAHEERDLEPFAARHAVAPEMKDAQAAVRRAHKGDSGTFFAWLTDGADPDTARALRRMIPPAVLFLTTRVGGRHYKRHVGAAWT